MTPPVLDATEQDLAELPADWLEWIAAGDYIHKARKKTGGKATWTWIKSRPEAKGEPCKQMARALETGLSNLAESSSGAAHDELTDRVYELLRLSVEGHRGVYSALVAIRDAFVYEVAERRRTELLAGGSAGAVRTSEEARSEFRREVDGGVSLMLGHLAQPEMVEAGLGDGSAACSCWEEPVNPLTGEVEPSGRAKPPHEYEYDDIGNKEQLCDLADGNLIWVKSSEKWFCWDDAQSRYVPSLTDPATGLAQRVAYRVKAAAVAAKLAMLTASDQPSSSGGPSDWDILDRQQKGLFAHHKYCGRASAVANMVRLLKEEPEISVPAERLDMDGRLLHCADGTVLELNDDGLGVRPATREDRLTLSTHVPYVPGAKDALWEDYLDTFIPDPELRSYMQRLLGYSLLGGNPRRLLVFLHGPTSSGKSTVVEAACAALGDYGGTFGMSVFKESADEGPRPDLLRILPTRVAFASETSSARVLHAEQIKRLTGGDTISARGLYSNVMVERVPMFTPFIATNSTPRINGADAALLDRRLVVVPFDVQVTGDADDMNARDRLRTSPSARIAILAWLAAGWQRYMSEGLDAPQAVVDRTNAMREDVSEFHGWWHSKVEVTGDKTDVVIASVLYDSYKAAMLGDNVDAKHILNAQAFGRAVTAQGVAPSENRRVKGLGTPKCRYGLILSS